MGWWNEEFKVCSFGLKMSTFRITISVYKFVFCSYFSYHYISLQICILLLLFCISINQKNCSKRVSDTGAFLWILQNFEDFFIEHLRTAAFKTVTEDSLGNSARNGKLHIISPVDVWLGSKWDSAQRLILENKMKNVEHKVMLKC